MLGATEAMLHHAETIIVSESETEYLAELPAAAFPILPDSGWLETGELYAYDGGVVMVRQSHDRMHYAPAETPALFWTVNSSDEWMAGEWVNVGTRRTYEGVLYEAIQAHTTESTWQPPNVPALWRAVQEPTAEWQAWTAYTIGDVVTYSGAEYECRQSHTSQPGWEPPNVLALWLPL